MLNFDEVMAVGGPAHRLRLDDLSRELDPDEPINIQFTSGTTGSPEGRDADALQYRQQRPLRRPARWR